MDRQYLVHRQKKGQHSSMKQHYQEDHFFFEAEGYRIPAALTLPERRNIAWSLVLIPGSMSNDVDGNYLDIHMHPHMYADLARQLAERGHAVLRYAKAGPKTGTVVVDEQQVKAHRVFPRQQYIATATVRKLREMFPQARGLAVMGHSEESVHGLMIAQQSDLSVDAFVSLSGPAFRYIDLFIYKAREL